MWKVFAAVLLAACGSARIIQMTPTGGIIELVDDRSKAMEQATGEMNKKCGPNNFTIVQDGWEPADSQAGSPDPAKASSTSSAMVWRVHFQCNGAIGGPPPPPMDMPPVAPPGPPQPDPSAPPPPAAGY